MAVCLNADSTGRLLLDAAAAPPNCPGYVLQTQAEYTAITNAGIFDPASLDPVAVANAIGSGFLLVAPCLLLIVGGRMVLYPFFHK
ncbi:MAG: hypothetical protein PHT19_01525 [Methylococcus sp.]|nr:hypothetical protein [Methylococcus sp.]